MIKFVGKDGKKVMEMKDNGELKVTDAELKESFDKKEAGKVQEDVK